MPIHKSTFEKGKNKDISIDALPGGVFTDAKNITLSEEEGFLVVTNNKGTSTKQTILTSASYNDLNVMDVASCIFSKADGDDEDCLCVFYSYKDDLNNVKFSIGVYRVSLDSFINIYTEDLSSEDILKDSVSVKRFREKNRDYLYFTSHSLGYFRLDCILPAGVVSANYLTKEDLEFLQEYPSGIPELMLITEDGGSLLCGGYQFTYRLVNEDDSRSSQWTLMTNPVHLSKVTPGATDADEIYYGRRGEKTKKSITVTTDISARDISKYTHIQWAVLQNVEGLYQTTLSARKYSPQPLPVSPGSILFKMLSNSDSESAKINVDEIVTEKAAIHSFKTIDVSINRLIGANIKYRDLSYDNSTPAISGAVIEERKDTYDVPNPDTGEGGLPKPSPDPTLYSRYFNNLDFVNNGALGYTVDGVERGTQSLYTIGIGATFSIPIVASYAVSPEDVAALQAGTDKGINLKMEIIDGSTISGTLVETINDFREDSGMISVSRTVTEADITGDQISISVTLERTATIGGV